MKAIRLLRENIIQVGEALKAWLPDDLMAEIEALKTFEYYQRVLNKDVLQLYRGDMTEAEFIDDMVRLIDEQFTRAFNEGMRLNELDPAKDMKPEWEDLLQERKLKEFDYVDNYAAEIVKAAKEGADVAPFQARVDMWANRYGEIVSWAQIITRPEDRYKWVVGPTEHCSDCAMLNGIVATGADWIASGWQPQGSMLECGGFRCQCSLVYTEEKVTEGGIPSA